MEWIKRNTLRRFGNIEIKKSEEFVKKVYVSDIDSLRKRRPVVSWKDRVKEYMHDRGEEIELVRRECVNRKNWKLFCCGHPLGGRFQREKGVRNYRLDSNM